jgi:hypothetical protein
MFVQQYILPSNLSSVSTPNFTVTPEYLLFKWGIRQAAKKSERVAT